MIDEACSETEFIKLNKVVSKFEPVILLQVWMDIYHLRTGEKFLNRSIKGREFGRLEDIVCNSPDL